MEQFPVPCQACHCNNNEQDSWSDTKKVGYCLELPTFNHGQLCVAASNVGDPQRLHFALSKGVVRRTRNVVHKEIL